MGTCSVCLGLIWLLTQTSVNDMPFEILHMLSLSLSLSLNCNWFSLSSSTAWLIEIVRLAAEKIREKKNKGKPNNKKTLDYVSSCRETAKIPIVAEQEILVEMTSYVWRKYADYIYTKWERMILWTMVEPYSRPKSFTPLVTIYVAAFYTGVVGSAITEQLYKEKYWEDHPGQAVPLMKPKFYGGPWRVQQGEVPASQ